MKSFIGLNTSYYINVILYIILGDREVFHNLFHTKIESDMNFILRITVKHSKIGIIGLDIYERR